MMGDVAPLQTVVLEIVAVPATAAATVTVLTVLVSVTLLHALDTIT